MCLAIKAVDGAADDVAAGFANDVADEKESHGCRSSRSGEPSRTALRMAVACRSARGTTYFAVSVKRVSRIIVTLISPGYVSCCSKALAISRQILAADSSVVMLVLAMTRTSRPA